ncbi:MAG: aspartate kinase [Clostridiales bacterium]|jgi:aspartate kinase|nr:aspartate kinase [Clostridiales bacterium]
MLIVQKYGGSSVADPARMENVARRVLSARLGGHDVVVVVSARGNTTDRLLDEAQKTNPGAAKREVDMLLATGEQCSCALLAMMIQGMGHSALSLNAYQAGITATSAHMSARIKSIDAHRIKAELDSNQIVIVAGFQGVNRRGDVATLGRGGSDTTAVALAAVLHADICEIYTDVEGVYSADPRIVTTAVKLPEISYFEMLELASLGANVLAKRSVGLAKKYGVRLVVKSSMKDCEGTVVKEEAKMEGIYISGVAVDKDIVRVSISGVKDEPGVWFKVFSIMNRDNIAIDFIQQVRHDDGTKDITFTVAKDEVEGAITALNGSTHRLGFNSVSHCGGIAKLSVVSTGMATNPGVPSMMFEALFDAGINIDSISTSEIRASVLIDTAEADRAANLVHEKFRNGKYIMG